MLTAGTGESFWVTGLAMPGSPFPGGSLSVDYAVVGAGLGGLSAALHILRSQPGCRLAVLEADRVGAGASARNTGMVTPGVGQNLLSLVRRLGRGPARAVYQATLDAVLYVETLVRQEGIDCQLRRSGQLMVARGGEGRARLAALANTLDSLDLPVQRLDDGALARHVRLGYAAPGAATDPAALRLPIAGTLNPGRLLEGLARRVQELGGQIYERARVLAVGAGRPVRLALTRGEVIAAEVVVTVSGFSADLGLCRGRLMPVQLQALATEPLPASTLAALRWPGREGIVDSRRIFDYFRLTEDNRLIFGGGAARYAWAGRERSATADRARMRLSARLPEILPPEAARPRIATAWTGTIAYTLDAIPVIGRLTRNPAVVIAGGWCGHGVALSLAAGAWIAHIIRHGTPPDDLAWFRRRAPLVPFEPARWAAFRLSVGAMALLDRRS